MLAEDSTNDSTFTNLGDPISDGATSEEAPGGDALAGDEGAPGGAPAPSVSAHASRASYPLSPELLSQHISLLAKTGNGLSYAFVKLELRAKNVTSIDAIEQFPHLRYVDLSENLIKEIEPLAHLDCLLSLDMHGNQIRSIPSNLDKCKYLQSCNFAKNHLLLIDIVGWPMLVYFNLSQNEFMELNLREFPELQHLEARENKITSTAGINAPKLRKLYLAQNNIKSLEGLDDKSELDTLHLRDNKLANLDGFSADMQALAYLNLRQNQISNFDELTKLSVLPSLRRLVLSENPIYASENYRLEVLSRLPRLDKLDKDTVTPEEREEAEQFRLQQETERAKLRDIEKEGDGQQEESNDEDN